MLPPETNREARIAQLQEGIAALTARLSETKVQIAQATQQNTMLARSAAIKRAENQRSSRGLFTDFLPKGMRTAVREVASASNARIANTIARDRTDIATRKIALQDLARQIQAKILTEKQELKSLTTAEKSKANVQAAANKTAMTALDLMQKLKNAQEAGLLTEAEYEEKRKRLLAEL
jgi:hypothetical protein